MKRVFGYFGPELNFVPLLKSERNSKLRPDNQVPGLFACAYSPYLQEIKFSISPSISKGFYQSIEDLRPDFSYVITPSGEAFNRDNGVRICPLRAFLEEELGKLG